MSFPFLHKVGQDRCYGVHHLAEAGFTCFVLFMLALDLGVFHRQAHVRSLREASIWSALWITLALSFNAGIYVWIGQQQDHEFLTGYLIEKSLSLENIFVWMVISDFYRLLTAVALGTVAGILAITMLASYVTTRKATSTRA